MQSMIRIVKRLNGSDLSFKSIDSMKRADLKSSTKSSIVSYSPFFRNIKLISTSGPARGRLS
jgi:hypothetical protein